MMQPLITINWVAIVVAFIAAFVFGGIWYGPLFGKIWGRAIGMDCESKPDPKVMRRAFLLQIIGLFLTAYVLTHSIQVWRPSAWGLGGDMSDTTYGFLGGFFTWIGFYVPLQLNKVGWEGRPWKVFFINAGHDFINLQILCQILSHWK